MPGYDGWTIETMVKRFTLEVKIYELLQGWTKIPTPRLLFARPCQQRTETQKTPPWDTIGRQLVVFERANGESNIWRELSES